MSDVFMSKEQMDEWKKSQENPLPCPCGGTAKGYDIGQGTCDRCGYPVYSDGTRGAGSKPDEKPKEASNRRQPDPKNYV